MERISEVQQKLLNEIVASDAPRSVLRSTELRELYAIIPTLPAEERSGAGKAINELKQALEQAVVSREAELVVIDQTPIDVTAPMDVNAELPALLPTEQGTFLALLREI